MTEFYLEVEKYRDMVEDPTKTPMQVKEVWDLTPTDQWLVIDGKRKAVHTAEDQLHEAARQELGAES